MENNSNQHNEHLYKKYLTLQITLKMSELTRMTTLQVDGRWFKILRKYVLVLSLIYNDPAHEIMQ